MRRRTAFPASVLILSFLQGSCQYLIGLELYNATADQVVVILGRKTRYSIPAGAHAEMRWPDEIVVSGQGERDHCEKYQLPNQLKGHLEPLRSFVVHRFFIGGSWIKFQLRADHTIAVQSGDSYGIESNLPRQPEGFPVHAVSAPCPSAEIFG